MNETDLINLIARKACAILEYDDAFPDVGMGMFWGDAIKQAEHEVLEEAARWNSVEALRLTFTDDMRKKVEAKLRTLR